MTAPAAKVPQDLDDLRTAWASRWQDALAVWSKFTRLSEPRWCFTEADEKQQRITESFAMIRLTDQAVVISLPRVRLSHVEGFALEVLAHEIGHHVYCPSSLLDQGRMLARMRRGLPTKEHLAPLVANLYADLLINDRLQRGAGLDIAGVYRILGGGSADRLWTLYMRIYEILWSLPRGTLATALAPGTGSTLPSMSAHPPVPASEKKAGVLPVPTANQLEGDAQLGARLVRSFAQDWLDGAGRFAALCLPYLVQDEGQGVCKVLKGWLDCQRAGSGDDGVTPAGLAEIDEGEEEGAHHPALDDDLTGLGGADDIPADNPRPEPVLSGATEGPGAGRARRGGKRVYRDYRGPVEYGAILKALDVNLSDHEITIRYYRERAAPHLVRFPTRRLPDSAEPVPEGLEPWDFGMPLEDADWFQSVLTSPHVVPGLTTVQRTYGTTAGAEPERWPIDLYLGVDCSGSMSNPQLDVSYPVLAGAILALSALRAGARVMVVLSGEPGSTVSTDGFLTNEHKVLEVLTGYLGTGYTFGVHRLADTFRSRRPDDRPAHILIVTDHDIYSMLDEHRKGELGWDVAREAVAQAGGGGTYVLQMPPDWEPERIARMGADGWQVHCVRSWDDLVAFARAFSRAHYAETDSGGTRRPAT